MDLTQSCKPEPEPEPEPDQPVPNWKPIQSLSSSPTSFCLRLVLLLLRLLQSDSAMGYSKMQLLARLQELQIEFSQYEHPVVLTVEAQAKYVGDKGGALSKNLLLKDKKNRYYIVSALPETKVDLKVLSQRLGLGKGGLRMAPEEALGQILQVPLGCVTPFALLNESASHVALLLDQGFKTQECCFFHPLSNDMSISLNIFGLDKFLKSIGRVPIYVDLEANPKVGKDQQPDLAVLVPSDSLVLPDAAEEMPTSKSSNVNNFSSDSKPAAATVANVTKASNNPPKLKDQSSSGQQPSVAFSDPVVFVEEILDKTCSLLLSEITKDSLERHSDKLGAVVADKMRKHLNPDLESLATIFKNQAFSEGFVAGTRSQPKRL